MTFFERATKQTSERANSFLSPEALQTLRNQRLLAEPYLAENLYPGIREKALTFFSSRKIAWHGNGACVSSLLSSQIAAVNFLFPLINRPADLLAIFTPFIPG